MSPPTSRQGLATNLQAAADSYQRANVIQHCAVCANPCCRLDRLVLELNWKQVKPGLDPSIYNLWTYEALLETPDPWKDFRKSEASLRPALKTMGV